MIVFTLVTEPGFLYRAEVSEDLVNWELLGDFILATGVTLEFTEAIEGERRFYRFRRTP